jgi:hypothetical protein
MKTVYGVGSPLPGDPCERIPHYARKSLLDADIVVFTPSLPEVSYSGSMYQGRPWLSESSSVRVKEAATHWQRELALAVEEGKTVFVFLADPINVWVDTGRKEHSGTGRNRLTTTIVDRFDSYLALPFGLKVVPATGTKMKLTAEGEFLSRYWADFAEVSEYRGYLESPLIVPDIVTPSGNKVLGGHVQLGKGFLICLPMLQDPPESFTEEIESEEGEVQEFWTKKAEAFGHRLISAFVAADASLRSVASVTAPPEWAFASEYQLEEEVRLLRDLEATRREMDDLESRRGILAEQLQEATSLRSLLYATGRELEESINQALDILGFQSRGVREGDVEFDAVFTSAEGRFLGEAEGKLNGAVNINKLSQLERNLQEDFAREDVNDFAKGVLFANAYRLKPLHERSEFFTTKCMSGARRASIALVRTPDLFEVARSLREAPDKRYATACRKAILRAAGAVVSFPPRPSRIAAKEQKSVKERR